MKYHTAFHTITYNTIQYGTLHNTFQFHALQYNPLNQYDKDYRPSLAERRFYIWGCIIIAPATWLLNMGWGIWLVKGGLTIFGQTHAGGNPPTSSLTRLSIGAFQSPIRQLSSHETNRWNCISLLIPIVSTSGISKRSNQLFIPLLWLFQSLLSQSLVPRVPPAPQTGGGRGHTINCLISSISPQTVFSPKTFQRVTQ